jgi:hypothetical protein
VRLYVNQCKIIGIGIFQKRLMLAAARLTAALCIGKNAKVFKMQK